MELTQKFVMLKQIICLEKHFHRDVSWEMIRMSILWAACSKYISMGLTFSEIKKLTHTNIIPINMHPCKVRKIYNEMLSLVLGCKLNKSSIRW